MAGFAEERELGTGASGRVVAAVHQASGTRVAIKYLSPRLLGDPGFLAAFRAEAQLLRSLQDAHVVRLYDYVEAPGQGAAIIMELVSGISLHQMITRQGPTTAESALLVLKGSLLGLASAHSLGIVHRDYKPENVLVDAQGESKLTDFGVATREGQSATVSGTPLYMAPEQWDGAPATPATDIYAATAVLFECLTGKTPFSGGLGQLAAQHAAAAVPVELVPEPVRELVARGLAKDPAARPANATALVTELEATAAAAYGPDWEARGRAQLAERAAALLLLLAHGSAAVAGGAGTATASTTLAGAKAAAGGKLALIYAGIFAGVFAVVAGTLVGISAARGGFRQQPAPSPSAGPAATALPRIAYATTTAVYTRSGSAAPDRLASLPAGAQASQLTWSPDGRWLGWFSGPTATGTNQVHVTDTRTGATHSWPCANCAVGTFHDGSLLVSGQGSLTRFPEDGGSPGPAGLPVLPGSTGLSDVLATTPGDASVLLWTNATNLRVTLYEATASGAVTLKSGLQCAPGGDRAPAGAGLISISPDGKVLAYGGNGLGGDPSEPSDCVTVVNLVTREVTVTQLPVDPAQPLRITAVWVDSTDTVHAIAFHQPGNVSVSGAVPQTAVVPRQYRLGGGHWADAGPGNLVAAGGQDGWTASVQEPASVLDFSPPVAGQLVATAGTRRVVIASGVTAFAWAPA